ncbi:MAG TPA: nitrilase-related carbon-nitrogen hydrolase [Kofleriaceae bacterium]|jgi:apolipoprotein N-acyltransferase|nr:nitrilase-related carbon-nitrogen hydrolase [Kofleriaceae bacterium]
MTTTTTALPTPPRAAPPRSWIWLALGALLVFASNLRWGVGALAWIAPVPWLYYLRTTRGWRSRLALGGTAMLAWTFATAKIVSAPLPMWFALLGIVFGLIQTAGYVLADRLRRRAGALASVAIFPAVMVVLEWAQGRFTGLATWAAAGYTQLDDLPLLQLASIAGLGAISFIVYAVAAAGELALASALDRAPARRSIAILAGTIAIAGAAHVWGAIRMSEDLGDTTRVAAIGTIATFFPDTPMTAADRAQILDALDADTVAAARAGAKLAVWTEAAAIATPDEEPALIARARAIAQRGHLHVVAAYVVPGAPRFQNKYVWVRPDGTIDHTYWKHHPAPGEPAVVGDAALTAIDADDTKMSGAICYDYDFPTMAAEHGALDVDLVAVPSSDWRGIDPIHTQMAAIRAIEQGFSIVRSTRFGLSAGIDPHGRLRAWRSSFDTPERVMLVDLPRHGSATIYRRVGDLWILACAAFVALALTTSWRARSSRTS